MNREEFLRQFREALDGKVSEQIINENVAYYRNYINNQVDSGKSEKEVLGELGDPRLLAKTIEESRRFTSGRAEEQRSYSGNYSNTQTRQSGQESYDDRGYYMRGKAAAVPGWFVALIVLLVGVFLVTVVFNVFLFFLPAIVAGVVVMFAYKLIKSMFK